MAFHAPRTRGVAAIPFVALGLVALVGLADPVVADSHGTPTAATCATASPEAGVARMTGAAMGSPMAEMEEMSMELDQIYIDMMIPHHAAIIAMAQAAEPLLEDERLVEIAQTIVATQGPEIEELRGYREQFYGDPEPMAMDDQMMAAMAEMMPGMSGTMGEMAAQMDPAAQVAAICAAEDPDLAFIEMTIAHHQMAIGASEVAVDQATNAEIRDFAQRVIDAQQREIEELTTIRQDLYGDATPTA